MQAEHQISSRRHRCRWLFFASGEVLLLVACHPFGASTDTPAGMDGGGSADGSVELSDASVDSGETILPSRRVFVTGATVAATALAFPDKTCSDIARENKGNWVAWVSTQGTAARDRIPLAHYFRYDDASVGTTAQVVGGVLENAILLDERGAKVDPQAHVWTGTLPDGGLGNNCSDWTTSNGAGGSATVGVAGRTGVNFTADTEDNCATNNRVYCFER